MKRVIWWVRADMRVHDNGALYKAAGTAASPNEVLPVFIHDTTRPHSRQLRIPRLSPLRAQFLSEGLTDLRSNLKEQLGLDLIVRVGRTSEHLAEIAAAAGTSHVVCSEEECSEERETEREVRASGLTLTTVWDSTMVHKADLGFPVEDLPKVFSPFRRMVEGKDKTNLSIRKELSVSPKSVVFPDVAIDIGPIPSVSELCGGEGPTAGDTDEVPLDPRAVLPLRGGESAGLARLHDYLWGTDSLRTYIDTRNGMVGPNYSSKLSPWLSHGYLSPRRVYWEVKKYEARVISNKSTYWLIFELLWRDFFKFLPLRVGESALFRLEGPRNVTKPWNHDIPAFKRWTDGTTGYPIIDANMRELSSTGWMSNRGRQIVASFLTKDLGMDWRWGAEWFEHNLIDHSPEANYGNWTYSAGVGTDPREDRYFSIPKQSATHDPSGIHAKLWVPELRTVDERVIHTPWAVKGPARWTPPVGGGVPLGDYAMDLCPRKLGGFAPKYSGGGNKGWKGEKKGGKGGGRRGGGGGRQKRVSGRGAGAGAGAGAKASRLMDSYFSAK